VTGGDSHGTRTDRGEATAAFDSDRVAQLNDDVVLVLTLPPSTEEWAEDLLRESEDNYGVADTVERTDDGLVLTRRIGGNCNALANARSWLAEVEEELDEGHVSPMQFGLRAYAVEPKS
jgi:hypothetical protein